MLATHLLELLELAVLATAEVAAAVVVDTSEAAAVMKDMIIIEVAVVVALVELYTHQIYSQLDQLDTHIMAMDMSP
jgi:hypothetical protein